MLSDVKANRRNRFINVCTTSGQQVNTASTSCRYGHKFALIGTAASILLIVILALFCHGGRYLDTSLMSSSVYDEDNLYESTPVRHLQIRQRSLQQLDEDKPDTTEPEVSIPCEDIYRRPPPEVSIQPLEKWNAREFTVQQEKFKERYLCQYATNCEGDWPSTFLLPLILCNGVDMGSHSELGEQGEAGSNRNNNAIKSLCIYLLLPPIILLYLYLLFRLLATTADSYFSPALETFSFELGLPPRFAGATLLALGNGSPDLGSTINSILLWNETTPSATTTTANMLEHKKPGGWTLCLGSLTGGGMFVGTIVSGLIVQSCNGINCRGAFLRDVSMYALSIMVVWHVLESNHVTRGDVYMLLGIWLGYVLIVLLADLYHRKVTLKRLHMEGKLRRESMKAEIALKLSLLSEGEDAEVVDELTPLVNKELADVGQSRLTTTDRFAMLMSNYDPASVKWYDMSSKSTVSDSDETSTIQNVIHQIHSIRRTSVALPVNEEFMMHKGSFLEEDESEVQERLLSFPEDLEEESVIDEFEKRSCSTGMLTDAYQELVYEAGCYWETHFVKEPSGFERFGFLLELPITILRTLTIPVPCEDHYNRIIVALSTLISPFWVVRYLETDFTSLPATVFTFAAGIVAYAVLRFGGDEKLPLLAAAPLSLYGFFIAATWIDVIGNYLVSLLQFLGIICRIPAPILGVTVLAWGNSLGDLSANLAMARKGAPDMATTANFAGPSFNLLVGMGCGFLSLQHKLHSTSIFPVSLTQSIRIGFSFNIINCLLIIICAICCQWRIPHRYSCVFFVLYAMFIAMSLMTLIRN